VTARRRWPLALGIALGLGSVGPDLLPFLSVAVRAASAEEEAAERVKAALLDAAGNPTRLAKVLDESAALVGPSAVFPDLGALADWLGTLPASVSGQPMVSVRRAWMYVSSKRGADAIPLLEPALVSSPRDALLRSYLGEARRQAGDLAGAVVELARALDDGATDELALPSVRKVVYEIKTAPNAAPTEGLPTYATAAATFLARREARDVRQSVIEWLLYDADPLRATAARSALLRAEAIRHLAVTLRPPVPVAERMRLARRALEVVPMLKALPEDVRATLPTAFDLLVSAVRLGEAVDPEGNATSEGGHLLPEALAFLAEEALAKGRYVLADALARRRLAISDSPTARAVLRGLPPDVGD